jgi:hypothetical protein
LLASDDIVILSRPFTKFDCSLLSIMSNSKGSPIKIIGGTHVGLSGWLNKTKGATNEYVHVIVKNSKKGEIATKVKHENYVLETELIAPSNYEEAMLQQHSDIDALLNKLVRSIAECEPVLETEQSYKNFLFIVKKRLEKAKARQDAKGAKARWRKVLHSASKHPSQH